MSESIIQTTHTRKGRDSSMPEHRFDKEESLDDNVPPDETVKSVRYLGQIEIVETERQGEGGQDTVEGLSQMGRAEVYSIAQDEGVDVSWTGDDADSTGEMIEAIEEHRAEADMEDNNNGDER